MDSSVCPDSSTESADSSTESADSSTKSSVGSASFDGFALRYVDEALHRAA